MFSGLKLTLIVAAIAALVIGGLSLQVNSLKKENKVLLANNAKLEVAVQTQKDAIEAIEVRVADMVERNDALNAELRAITIKHREYVQIITQAQGRLGNAMQNKPELARAIVNRAVSRVLRDYGEATGYKDRADRVGTAEGGEASPASAAQD